ELIQEFSLERVNKSGAKFDVKKAFWFNHHYLMEADDAELAEKLMPLASNFNIETDIEYLKKAIHLMKEKINFLPQMFTEGIYFFNDPETYNEEMLAKKLNPETMEILNQIYADYQGNLS